MTTASHVQYYLLVDEDGGRLNQQVLPYVGDQIVICGQVKKMGDWLVLYKDNKKGFTRLPKGIKVDLPACGG